MTPSLLLSICVLAAGTPLHHPHAQDRAQHGMGFDQQSTTHHFILERAGGTIEVTAKAVGDKAVTNQIRAHLQHIASAFGKGDFTLPVFIHDTDPPGASTMKERRSSMTFSYEDLPAGGKVIVRTKDRAALDALHSFLRFQIREHRTGDPLEPK
jgi:hypothetical protein